MKKILIAVGLMFALVGSVKADGYTPPTEAGTYTCIINITFTFNDYSQETRTLNCTHERTQLAEGWAIRTSWAMPSDIDSGSLEDIMDNWTYYYY